MNPSAPKPISPSAMVRASGCLHSWTHECFGDPALKGEPDAGTRLRWEQGLDLERKRVEALPVHVRPEWDGSDWEAGYRRTVELMKAGRPWIYQGVLVREPLRGLPDLLKRKQGVSRLGKHTYIPIDIKGHKEVEPGDRLQLAAYALLLEPVLGKRPTEGGIWLNTGEIETVPLVPEEAELAGLLGRMEEIRAGKAKTSGIRCGECGTCPWIDLCGATWKKAGSVCLLYGITGDAARTLQGEGYSTWKAIARSELDVFIDGCGLSEKKARAGWFQARAWAAGKPQRLQPVSFPTGIPIHFYDIETYEDRTYLHGVIRVHGAKREERQFVARRPEEEGAVWEQFTEFLGQDDRAWVYSWGSYEKRHVAALRAKYGGNQRGLKRLERLEDQCAFVKKHFALPVSSYGIKKVAPLFGFKWDAEDAGGLNSEAWYRDWLATGDEKLLAKIKRYNLDDVRAMEVIDRELRAFGAKQGNRS